jgi:1-acyl-sn-glycerol-3-phosphate acyltransferase
VPIVPVYIEGSFDAMPRGVNLPRPRKVRVRFGKPFLPDEVLGEGGRREKYQALADAMMQRIAGIREAALR